MAMRTCVLAGAWGQAGGVFVLLMIVVLGQFGFPIAKCIVHVAPHGFFELGGRQERAFLGGRLGLLIPTILHVKQYILLS